MPYGLAVNQCELGLADTVICAFLLLVIFMLPLPTVLFPSKGKDFSGGGVSPCEGEKSSF